VSSRFVVHEHDAHRLHYDFRLEIKGVLRSWAMPKGPSMDPAVRHLAVQVEDHTVDYIDFEGIIPEGNYGAGAVIVWDEGTFRLLDQGNEKLSFELSGKKLKGAFTLLKFKKSKSGKDWLLIKKKDEFAEPGWTLKTALTQKKRSTLKEKIPPCETS
jgi:bifunctional non-homologous end joining protein LigD